MAVSALYVLDHVMAGGEFVQVPDIQGLPITEASRVLAEAGLELGAPREIVTDEVPLYHVIAQQPEAGAVLRTGRRVAPTVSGREHASVPEVVGRTLSEAQATIEQNRFTVGATARMPHEASRDTVLAQDPPPNSRVDRTGEINLLLSAGTEGETFLMPDLIGTPVEEALNTLSSLGVNAQAHEVETTDGDYDVVLDHYPPPGTVLREGDVVQYDVRPSGQVEMPTPRRRVEVGYTVPNVSAPVEVRMDVIGRTGARRTAFPRQSHYVDGAPPRFEAGTTITLPVAFYDEVTVEVYLNGERVRSYYYEGNADAVVTDF